MSYFHQPRGSNIRPSLGKNMLDQMAHGYGSAQYMKQQYADTLAKLESDRFTKQPDAWKTQQEVSTSVQRGLLSPEAGLSRLRSFDEFEGMPDEHLLPHAFEEEGVEPGPNPLDILGPVAQLVRVGAITPEMGEHMVREQDKTGLFSDIPGSRLFPQAPQPEPEAEPIVDRFDTYSQVAKAHKSGLVSGDLGRSFLLESGAFGEDEVVDFFPDIEETEEEQITDPHSMMMDITRSVGLGYMSREEGARLYEMYGLGEEGVDPFGGQETPATDGEEITPQDVYSTYRQTLMDIPRGAAPDIAFQQITGMLDRGGLSGQEVFGEDFSQDHLYPIWEPEEEPEKKGWLSRMRDRGRVDTGETPKAVEEQIAPQSKDEFDKKLLSIKDRKKQEEFFNKYYGAWE